MLKNIFILLLSFALLLTAAGCKKKCGDCMHGGSCSGNICSCPDPWSGTNCDTMCNFGYEGYMCATLSKTKFFGTYTCTSTDQSGMAQTYQISITDYPSVDLFMYLNNFNNDGSTIVCTLTGKAKFDINTQTTSGAIHVPVDGYSDLKGNKLTLYLTDNGMNFFATATKQ